MSSKSTPILYSWQPRNTVNGNFFIIVITPYNFEHDDFLSDYKSSVKFWKFANKLVQYTQSSLVIRKNSNNGREAGKLVGTGEEYF